MKKAVNIKVSRQAAQKNGYCRYARLAAEDFSIVGKMEKLSDGSVYIEAQGEEDSLNDFIAYCQSGPAWARVNEEDVEIVPMEVNESFTEFLS
ncbi:MAG: acylphosphatase [Bacteroidales bacterium]|nr:acylphosphatase [Bacteroidales bacterium]